MLHLALLLPAAVAPSFDTFLTHSLGRWRGACYCWQRDGVTEDGPELFPLGIAPGCITSPTPSSTVVTEIMRSCGGAVQGVQEERSCQPADGVVMLNRQVDGTTFFSYGSWAQSPTRLSAADEEDADLLSSASCFGLSVCLAHSDETRRRLLVVVSELSTVLCCDVAVEGRAATEDDALTDVATTLLDRRIQCVVDASAWEGGASVLDLSGEPAGGAWLNARLKWSVDESEIDGGAPLVPPPSGETADVDVAHLPGGCWVRVARRGCGGADIEVGSLSVEAGETKTVTHEFMAEEGGGGGFRLGRVRFGKVVARD